MEQYQGNLEWIFTPPCGDAGYSAIDFLQPQNVYVACAGISVQKSTDGGNTFSGAENGIDANDSSDFIPPLVMDPSDSSRLYFGTYRLYQTLDGANSWTAISPDLTSGTEIAAIAVAPSDSNTVYTGAAYSGIVYVTRNALAGTGATWSEVNLPFPLSLTQITVDPQNPLTAWAAVTGPTCCTASVGLVYKTTNGGATWANFSNAPL